MLQFPGGGAVQLHTNHYMELVCKHVINAIRLTQLQYLALIRALANIRQF